MKDKSSESTIGGRTAGEASIHNISGGAASEAEKSLAVSPTAEEGHRLIHAFLTIQDAALRESIISFVSDLARIWGKSKPPDSDNK
jgi:hypothetical protein